MTTVRRSSADKIPNSARGSAMHGGQSNSVVHLHHSTQAAKNGIHHSHHSSAGQPHTMLLNTELRAQARREREATRETKPASKVLQVSQQPNTLHSGGFVGRERSSSLLSNQTQSHERKISPPKAVQNKRSTEMESRASGHVRATVPTHLRKLSSGPNMTIESSLRGRPAIQQSQSFHSMRDVEYDESFLQRKAIDHLASRIPSPPPSEETRDFDPVHTAYFVKYYYEMAEKCESWQRYATNMKSKAETLDLENKILKDITEKQERELRSLQGEVAALRRRSIASGIDANLHDEESNKESEKEAEEEQEEQRSTGRGGSSVSDAVTVTGNYLQDIVVQKRRLRKASQSQQQQLHHLQARMHVNSNTSLSSAHSGLEAGGSRPSSRLSNHTSNGLRTRTRSRAGSCTVHDSIPVEKDDVFSSSSDLQIAPPIKRASSMPLGFLDVGEGESEQSRMQTEISPAPSHASTSRESALKEGEGESLRGGETSAGEVAIKVESDPKGAHRRLYIRLRDELETADLVRFERYVHRYDALEIGVEGSRGIINRVRRLLLPEELVRSKLEVPDKYKLRKELAREFERIVREDAVPKEDVTTSQQEDSQ